MSDRLTAELMSLDHAGVTDQYMAGFTAGWESGHADGYSEAMAEVAAKVRAAITPVARGPERPNGELHGED